MSGWILWLIVACVFGIGEMLTTGFFLAPFALGAALAAVTDAVGAGGIASWVVFVLVSILSLAVIRPIAQSHIKMPPQIRTGAAALIGKQAIVLERIANDEGVGCVQDRRRGLDRALVRRRRGDRDGNTRGGDRDQGRDGARDRVKENGNGWSNRRGRGGDLPADHVRADDPDRSAGAGRDRRAVRALQPHARRRDWRCWCRSSTG